MPDLELRRGDRATIAISDLLDANNNPATFGAGDVLIWTAKADLAQSASEALIVKSSASGGISYMIGGSTATVLIFAADWTTLQLRGDLAFVWDLQLSVGGDPAQIVTLTSGDGIIRADVTDNPITDPIPGAGLVGPCTPWVTVGEVAADPRAVRADGSPLPIGLLTEKIDVASEILYRLSGRQFAGVCSDVVRPTRRWYRSDYQPPWQWQWLRGWGNYTSRPPHRADGSIPLQEITLGAYPLRSIIEVRINGDVLDPTTYRIDDRRWLVNIDPYNTQWPIVPDMSGDVLTTVDTFQVMFEWGQAPPVGGTASARRFAIELAKGAVGDPCALPERVMSINTQGTSLALLDPLTFLAAKQTGIYEVDLWLKSVNPNALNRRSSVLSPDFPRPVRRTATTPGS